MTTFLDTHVHVYPGFNFHTLWNSALQNATRINSASGSSSCPLLLFLTERPSENFFLKLQKETMEGFTATSLNSSLVKISKDGKSIYFIAGKQVVTKEKLEVLALITSDSIPSGLSIQETISQVKQKGAVPVIPWSPGKWLFKRGKVLDELFSKASPSDFLIGDIAMRAQGTIENLLLKLAKQRQFTILAGSDPLPKAGEEKIVCSYSSLSTLTFDETKGTEELKRILLSPETKIAGRRNGLAQAMSRWMKPVV